jgi:hypothetical protein
LGKWIKDTERKRGELIWWWKRDRNPMAADQVLKGK